MTRTAVKRERELKWLPLERIIKNERNPRQKRSFTPEQLAPLRLSVEEHGVLEPLMVQPYDDDMYLLLEGERRWSVARGLKLKEVPAVIVNRQDEQEQVVLMFNIHQNRKGWEMAEELTAVKELKDRNGHMTDEQLAKKLGYSQATLRDRLQVLAMGEEVVADIARDRLDYSSALRSDQLTKSLSKKRPEVVKKLGGESGVRRKLLAKAKSRERGGISQELVEARKDLVDSAAMPDELVQEYLEKPEMKLREVRRRTESLEERRKVEDLAKEIRRLEREMNLFRIDLKAAPNLRELRNTLASLINSAQKLEQRVTDAIHKKEDNRAGH
jgi:ParB/RepB/Spo0J family partition protein